MRFTESVQEITLSSLLCSQFIFPRLCRARLPGPLFGRGLDLDAAPHLDPPIVTVAEYRVGVRLLPGLVVVDQIAE